MRAEGELTDKGRRRVAEILDAALRCLARDGYAATSIQRVADEAGLNKRAVLYYYGSREGLFEHVVHHLGAKLFDELERDLEQLPEIEDVIDEGYRRLWVGFTTNRALLVAWFGLRAEAITNEALRPTARYLADRFRRLVAAQIDGVAGRGRELKLDRDSLEVLILAGTQGLLLEYVERGETPALERAIADFQAWLRSVTRPVDGER